MITGAQQIYCRYIQKEESSTRVALSRKCPALLPCILYIKITTRFLRYSLNPEYFLEHRNIGRCTNITDHSAPLFRKFNARELDEAKIENIRLALQKIDGLVIPPGKVFSFWKYVGKPTIKRGFKNGLILSDGSLREGVGGGLCQLSNFLAYMFACSECVFIERKHHSRDVFPDSGRNIPFASGATVFYNLIDLRVANTTKYPIRVSLRMTGTQLRGSLSTSHTLDTTVKLEERNACFIQSKKSKKTYRCNQIYRVVYAKGTRQKLAENILWTNVARVMYSDAAIHEEIITIN